MLGDRHSGESRSPGTLQRRLDAGFRRHDDSKTRPLFLLLALMGAYRSNLVMALARVKPPNHLERAHAADSFARYGDSIRSTRSTQDGNVISPCPTSTLEVRVLLALDCMR